MNVLHMKYAVEVAKKGSLNKAAETLLVAQPNLSRSIKELEAHIGIAIFDRTSTGMKLTPDGEEFINYAKSILGQIDEVERMYISKYPKKQTFSISVPRSSYIAHALVRFSRNIGKDPVEIFYKETNTKRTINNILDTDYKLGIIRYAANYESYFKERLEEKGLSNEVITEFRYRLIVSRDNPLAKKEKVVYEDLVEYIEIAHADPYVPSLSLAKVKKEELPDNIDRRIYIFERASQLSLLSGNPETFMWCSPVPQKTLDRYNLVQIDCQENNKIYRDVLIYKNGYKLSAIDKKFIAELKKSISETFE